MTQQSQSPIAEAIDGARQMLRLGRLDEAESLLNAVIDTCDSPDALQLLGLVLSEQGRHDDAAARICQALELVGPNAALEVNLGSALLGAGRCEEAINAFMRSLALRPNHASTLDNLSTAYRKAGLTDEAIVMAVKAIELSAGLAKTWNTLGLALRQAGRTEDAILALQRAVELRDDKPGPWANLAYALLDAGRGEEALTAAAMAARLGEGDPQTLETCAAVLIYLGRAKEAVELLGDVVRAAPNSIGAWMNRGSAYLELGRFDEALADFRQAIALGDPTGEARSNASLALLLTGQFDEGWPLHEYRWSRPDASPHRPFESRYPCWNGSPLRGECLLVWGEQGIGDEIMFAGLLSQLTDRGGNILVECNPRLVPLFERSFDGVSVVARQDPPADAVQTSGVTWQVPMGSLPLYVRPETLPPRQRYLQADEAMVETLRDTYGRDALRVGIAWHSGNRQEGAKRSLPLQQWGPVLQTSGVRFVSLQYGHHAEEIAAAAERFDAEIIHDETVDPLIDMDRFAAQIAAMDLVISIDNSTVHLAGALGLECWTLLPYVPDWRWMAIGEATHWYASMRLLRQTDIGDFRSVIKEVALQLAKKSIRNT